MWLDDLFPKAKFLDALAMVEKAGHKKRVMAARSEMINEAKPKDTVEEDDFGLDADGAAESGENVQNTTTQSRPRTPTQDDVPDDEDLYGATPRNARSQNGPDDEDDLDALIAEAEGQDSKPIPRRAEDDEEDEDLDALIAEAESNDQPKVIPKAVNGNATNEDFADEEAAMQEMDGLW